MSASVAALAPFLLPVSSLSSTLLDTSEKTSELSLRALCLTAEPQQSPLLSVLFSRRPKRGPLATYRKDFPLGRDGQPGKASVMPLMGGRYQVMVPHKLCIDLDPRRIGASQLEAFLSAFLEASEASLQSSVSYPSPSEAEEACKKLIHESASKKTFGGPRSHAMGGFRTTNTLTFNRSGADTGVHGADSIFSRTLCSASGSGNTSDPSVSPVADPGVNLSPPYKQAMHAPLSMGAGATRGHHGSRMMQAAISGTNSQGARVRNGLPLPPKLAAVRQNLEARSPPQDPGRRGQNQQAGGARPELGAVKHPRRVVMGSIQLNPPSRLMFPASPAHGGTGFRNMGNTCYMSAVLAALMGLLIFVDDLLDEDVAQRLRPHLGAASQSVYRAMFDIATEYRKQRQRSLDQARKGQVAAGGREDFALSSGSVCDEASVGSNGASLPVVPKKLKDALARRAPHFADNTQQDASEFFFLAIDALADEMCDADFLARKAASEAPKPPLPLAVHLNFGGQLLKTMCCNGCGHSWSRTEDFYSLSLQLPPSGDVPMAPLNIQQLLEAHFAPTTIEVTCEKCKAPYATLTHALARLPRILPIHLMRFDFSRSTIVKRSDAVKPSNRLTLAFIASSATAPPYPIISKRTDQVRVCGANECDARTKGAASASVATTPATSRAPDATRKRSFHDSLRRAVLDDDSSQSPLAPPPITAIAAAAPQPVCLDSSPSGPGRPRNGGSQHERPASREEEECMLKRVIAASLEQATTIPTTGYRHAISSARVSSNIRSTHDCIVLDGVDRRIHNEKCRVGNDDVISLCDEADTVVQIGDEESPSSSTESMGERWGKAHAQRAAQPCKRADDDSLALPGGVSQAKRLRADTSSESARQPSQLIADMSEEEALAAAIATSLADTAVHAQDASSDQQNIHVDSEASQASCEGGNSPSDTTMNLDGACGASPPARGSSGGGLCRSGDPRVHAAYGYTLQSVVWHKGADAAFGHYLADVKVNNVHTGESQWHRYDDAFVECISIDAAIGGRAKSVHNGYLFFYTSNAVCSAI